MAILQVILIICSGMILGSFIGLAVVRIPRGESLWFPRSHCRYCQKTLHWHENIPIFSYLLKRGRCGNCKVKYSSDYFWIELITTLIILWAHFVIQPLPRFILYFFLFLTPMILLLFLDLKALILPDKLTIPGVFFGFVAHWMDGRYFSSVEGHRHLLLESLIGAAVGFFFFLGIALLYQTLRKKEGLGGGDIKLAAMIGAFFGWQGLAFIILMASVLGSCIGIILIFSGKMKKETPLPFGTFLAGASIIYLFYGQELVHLYLSFFRQFL